MAVESEERSIASSVKELVSYHPSVHDCLTSDLLNYSAVADFLKPEVESNLKKKGIRSESIKVALIRLRDELKRETHAILEKRISNIIKNSKLELKNEVIVMTVGIDSFRDRATDVVLALDRSRFMQLTQGVSSATLALDSDLYNDLKGIFAGCDVREVIPDQSAIVMISPKEIMETPGVISYIVSSLSRNGVNITQIMSCHTDTVLIVSRKQALQAYSILENAILGIRQLG